MASRAKDNEQSKGRPSLSLSEFLDIAARHRIHAYLLPFRQLEGFLRMMSIHIKKLKEIIPYFTTIWWRIERMKINLDPQIDLERDDIVIAVDSTGIKVINRGEWIFDKWKNKRIRRKGFIKIHVAVDKKTKKIVSMKVTKEDVHDGLMLKELVDDDTSKRYNIKKVMADGAYDSKDNFRYLDEINVIPAIKVRKNSSVKNNAKCIPRKLSVIQQLEDLKRWKRRHGYGMRWMAESAFSSIKRTFGEHVLSIKWNNMVNELMLKASIYNLFMDQMTT
ncbi:MAG: IS5 family transposase [Candidatus Nitrosocosmicus sp.]|nr:IS5 family transposase [Candidatus Nitrosocosmicus sp.]